METCWEKTVNESIGPECGNSTQVIPGMNLIFSLRLRQKLSYLGSPGTVLLGSGARHCGPSAERGKKYDKQMQPHAAFVFTSHFSIEKLTC